MSTETYLCPKCGGPMISYEYNPEFIYCLVCGYDCAKKSKRR